MVAVLNKNLNPLMSCSERKARVLLTQGKAKVYKKNPFTIQLKYGSSGYMQNDAKEEIPGQPLTKEREITKSIPKQKSRKVSSQKEKRAKFQVRKRWGKLNTRIKHKRRKHG